MVADVQLAALRRQLAALSYDSTTLMPSVAPLVAALLGDLVKATDSYRTLKAQAGDAGQVSQNLQYQADVLRREVGRLSGENSRLHQDLLREAEARAAQEARGHTSRKELEARTSDLEFAKQQALERAAVLERERDGLRAKVRDLLSFGRHHAGDELELKAAYSSFSITTPLEPRPAPAAQAKASRGAISLIKAADSRILVLEADLRRREADLQALVEQAQQAKDALAQRDGEIARLATQLAQGPDVDRLAQQYRTEANEAVILQLNQQVEALTGELVEVQRRAVDRGTLEAAEQAQQQAEARANALAAEREGVAREVEQMQAALVRLQHEAVGEAAARQKLGRLRATLEAVRGEKALLEGQLTHAETKVAELRDRLEQREGALRKAQNRCKQLEAEPSAGKQQQQQQPAGSGGRQQEEVSAMSLQSQCESLTEQLRQAKLSQEEAAGVAVTSQRECEQLREQVQQLKQQMQRAQLQVLRTEEQLAKAVAVASTPVKDQDLAAAEPAVVQHDGSPAAACGLATEPNAGSVQQHLASQVEHLEFERTELLVKLEESEKQVAALKAAAAGQSDRIAAAEGKTQAVDADGCGSGSGDWQLAAGAMPAMISSSEQDLEAARQREDALRQQVQQLQDRMQQLEGQAAGLQEELAVARTVTSSSPAAAASLAAVADLRRQLQERSQEVTDLSSLSIKADATVQQYMAQLRSMATELRAAELRLNDAGAQLARRTEEVQRHEAELAELRGVVGALDAERDALQAELDRRAEGAAAGAGALAAQCQRAEDAERALVAAEARLAATTSRLVEQEALGQQQQGEVNALGQQLVGFEAEYGALRDEYRAVTDDLAALVKENQVVNNQLSSMTAERHELAEQVKVQSTRSHYNEQLARAREQDVSELRTAYEGLAHENQRLQQSLTELTRELQARDAELVTRGEEVASLHEAQRSVQSQINMYISDLQAYERQLDAMDRAMRRGDEATDGLDRERHALLEQLRAAEQVRFQLERAQEMLQRQLVHAEGGIGVLEARLSDAQSDSEALRQRVALEQARVGELEGLLAIARADQYKRDAVAAEAGPERQVASLQEQKRLLDEQVATLQRQVDGLVQRREAQDQELTQLRSRLAVEFEAGASRGSRSAQERGEALAQQLLEAQQRCSELAREAEDQRAEAARLAGMRDGAEAALQAAQAEMEEVKGILVQQEAAQGGAEASGASSAKLEQLERRNCQLVAQLEALEAEAGRQGQLAAGMVSKVEELQQENERLLGLLSHMDGERARLARERQDLLEELVRLRATAADVSPSPGSSSGGGGVGSAGALTQQVEQVERRRRQLEGELQAERRRRQQAELDFQELLSSMDTLHGSPSPSSSAGSLLPSLPTGGSSLEGPQQQQQQQPQQQVWQLQEAVSTLQHVAQGLSSIGGEGGSGAWASGGGPRTGSSWQ